MARRRGIFGLVGMGRKIINLGNGNGNSGPLNILPKGPIRKAISGDDNNSADAKEDGGKGVLGLRKRGGMFGFGVLGKDDEKKPESDDVKDGGRGVLGLRNGGGMLGFGLIGGGRDGVGNSESSEVIEMRLRDMIESAEDAFKEGRIEDMEADYFRADGIIAVLTPDEKHKMSDLLRRHAEISKHVRWSSESNQSSAQNGSVANPKKLFPYISLAKMSEMGLIDPDFRQWLGKEYAMWDDLTDHERRIWYGQYLVHTTTKELITNQTSTQNGNLYTRKQLLNMPYEQISKIPEEKLTPLSGEEIVIIPYLEHGETLRTREPDKIERTGQDYLAGIIRAFKPNTSDEKIKEIVKTERAGIWINAWEEGLTNKMSELVEEMKKEIA